MKSYIKPVVIMQAKAIILVCLLSPIDAPAAFANDSLCASIKTDDLLACGQSALDEAETKLNGLWKTMRHSPELVKAQKAWLDWRDAECEAENYAKGGREEEIVRLACRANLTEQRVSQLQNEYKWQQ